MYVPISKCSFVFVSLKNYLNCVEKTKTESIRVLSMSSQEYRLRIYSDIYTQRYLIMILLK